MGIVASLVRPTASTDRGPLSDFWYQPLGAVSAAGMRVSEQTAMGVSAVWACVNLLADTIASLPLVLYERVSEQERVRATGESLYGILHDAPNDWQDAMSFRHYGTLCLLLRGNAYAYRWTDPRSGELEQLLPLHPDCVTPEKVVTGRAPNGMPAYGLRYRVRQGDGTDRIMTSDEVFHIRGPSLDGGLTGVSPIEYARRTIGLSLALDEYAARYFGNGARPGGILAPKENLSQDSLDRLVTQWNTTFRGPENAHKIAALPVDVTYQALSLSNEDSQFLESREHSVREIARWYRVPLHMIGETTKETSWGSGIAEQGQGFITYALRAWLVRWEQRIQRDLILDDRRFYAEHVVEGLLRGNIKERFEAYQLARQNGVINGEQWARFENWPVPDGQAGSAYWRPANMVDANAPPPPAPPAPPPMQPQPLDRNAHHALLLEDAATRVVRKELAALGKIAARCVTADAWTQAVAEFCREHVAYVRDTLHIPETDADEYCLGVAAALTTGGAALLEQWEARPAERVHVARRIAQGGDR